MTTTTTRPAVPEVLAYARALAPALFAARAVGASDAAIAHLERAAGAPLADGHRAFLRDLGGTPPDRLDPFLRTRDWSLEALLARYAQLRDAGIALPAGICLFTSTDRTGEESVLRRGAAPRDDPEVGLLTADLPVAFHPWRDEGLASYLRYWAFELRMGQLEHRAHFGQARAAHGAAEIAAAVARRERAFAALGLARVFDLDGGCACFDGGDLAATLYAHDASGALAGDREALARAAEVLAREAESPREG